MGQKTKIQWCDSTINPTLGCDGCGLWSRDNRACYAGVLTARFGRSDPGLADDFDKVGLALGRMAEAAGWSDLTEKQRADKPCLNGLPRLIFVGDMADNFSRDVPFEYLQQEIIAAVTSKAGSRHQWLWLTKRPKRMAKFSAWLQARSISWPRNLWAGTSVTTQQRTTRVAQLLAVGDGS
jgi:protein gp37